MVLVVDPVNDSCLKSIASTADARTARPVGTPLTNLILFCKGIIVRKGFRLLFKARMLLNVG